MIDRPTTTGANTSRSGAGHTRALPPWIRPVQVALVAVLIVLAGVTEAATFRSYSDLSAAGDHARRSGEETAAFQSLEREILILDTAAQRLARDGDWAAVDTQRARVAAQLRVVRETPSARGVAREPLRDIDSGLVAFDATARRLRATTDAAAIPRIAAFDPILSSLRSHATLAFERVETGIHRSFATGLDARSAAQLKMLGVSALFVLIALALAWSLRRTLNRDWADATRALRSEFDERRAAEAALRHGEERFRSLIQNSSDVVTIVDSSGAIVYQSPAAERVFGFSPHELEGSDIRTMLHPDDAPRVEELIARWRARAGVALPVQWRMRSRLGEWLHCETVAHNLLSDPNIRGFVLNTRDISERKSLEAELAHWAYHDSLTGLANRTLFRDRVGHALMRSQRHRDPVAVLFLDLDDFKRVNDSLGHAAGDDLLVQVAARLRECLRPEDTSARLGGDEFGILIEQCSDPVAPARVSERVIEALHAPFRVQDKDLFLTASIGIAISQSPEDSVEDLLRNADVAMYSVKGDGRGHYAIFRPDLHSALLDRLELEADLRRALDREEFVLHYQPLVALRTGEIVGVEALVRWNHPERGMLLPESFVPLAEQTGLVLRLDHWVIRRACRQAGDWHRMFPGRRLMMSVNVSARQLQDPKLLDEVSDAISDGGVDPRALTFEITESLLMHDTESTIQKLRALKDLGVHLAIDDFGTGYSSLSYLRRFPIDMLKVDKAFVDGVGTGVEETAFMGAIEKLARTLRLKTIVEGIEHAEQVAQLKQIGCEMGQGYYFSPAVPHDEIERFLEMGSRALDRASDAG